jgi:hypothetical protein
MTRNQRRRKNQKAKKLTDMHARREARLAARNQVANQLQEAALARMAIMQEAARLAAANALAHLEPDSEDEETPEDASEHYAKVLDMYGSISYNDDGTRVDKNPPEEHRCSSCRDKFCLNCRTCVGAPCILRCPCAPTICRHCMNEHIDTNGWECQHSDQTHFNCPTCRVLMTAN